MQVGEPQSHCRASALRQELLMKLAGGAGWLPSIVSEVIRAYCPSEM
jgi:hypothetical protein